MPWYAYECADCNYEFERQQSFDDDPIKVCPECGESSARRVISPVGVIFKGPGFYITDSRKALSDGKGPGSGTSSTTKEKKSESTTA